MATELGRRYRDTLTGYVGVATARTEYPGTRFSVCLERLDNYEEQWLAEGRLEPEDREPATRAPGFGG